MTDWSQVSALAAVVASIVAVIALWLQSRWLRFSIGVDLYTRYDELFRYDPLLRKMRYAAAEGLCRGESTPDLLFLFDFFDTIGFLMRRGAIDPEMVWNSVYHRAVNYWHVAHARIPGIKDARTSNPTIWEDYAYLVRTLKRIEARKLGRQVPAHAAGHEDLADFMAPSAQELEAFLVQESELRDETAATIAAQPTRVARRKSGTGSR